MGLVPDYYERGKVAATIVDRHQKGEKLHNIPVQTPQEPRLVINKSTSQMLNVQIPKALAEKAVFVE